MIAEAKPDEDAIIQENIDGDVRKISWRSFEETTNRLAWMLKEKGVGTGDTVLVTFPNSIEHALANFAIWKTGACYMPISPKTRPEELLQLKKLISPKAAFSNLEGLSIGIRWKSGDLPQTCAGYSCDPLPDILSNPNIITASGGTTGKPKLIRQNIPAGHTDGSLAAWLAVSGMRMGQRQLLAGPMYHGAPHATVLNCLFSGGTLVVPATMCPAALVDCIRRYHIQFTQLVPTLMYRILKLPDLKKEDFSSLEALCHTGGVCAAWLKRAWMDLLGPEKLYELYRGDEWIRHPGSVGKAKFGSTISIRDEEGRVLPPYEIGEIYMSPPANLQYTEYINAEPLKTLDGTFRSVGDMGYVDEEGYLYFSDRRCDMIVTGGENVFAAEVEGALLRNGHVLDAAVVGIPDPEWGRRVHAILETDGKVTAKELKEFLIPYLEPYKIPKTYQFVRRLKRTANGKIARAELLRECIEKEKQ